MAQGKSQKLNSNKKQKHIAPKKKIGILKIKIAEKPKEITVDDQIHNNIKKKIQHHQKVNNFYIKY